MIRFLRAAPAALLACALAFACSNSPDPVNGSDGSGAGGGPAVVTDRTCDAAPYPSAQWTQCEAQNFAKVSEAPTEQAANPAFGSRWQQQSIANLQGFGARAAADPSWLSPTSGNTTNTPVCATWGEQCVGDPFRYAEAAGPDGDAFYRDDAEVVPVVFYDDGCARLSGRLWRPRRFSGARPGIVIQNGSVQAPETLYWWAAELLVRSGYVVLSFDPRGQGRSDLQTPTGQQGSNVNSTVFWTGLVNAIDFFRSTAAQPYPHNLSCAGTYPTETTAFNPFAGAIDRDRLGIAGHSLGGVGVSVVQAYGAPGADPWPGLIDTANPVKVVVAWDGIFTQQSGSAGNAGGNVGSASGATAAPIVVPRVPIFGMNGEYGLTPVPFVQPPDPLKTTTNYRVWRDAGQPVVELTIQGSTHYEFSLLPTFPATSWCPDTSAGACRGGWGNALAQHYTLAWFDRWLKRPGEAGYEDADARLLDDDGEQGRHKFSFRYRSARRFPDRGGALHLCEDIRAGC